MTPRAGTRDIGQASGPGSRGRRDVATIGIDRYVAWPRLSNAVTDARGARNIFRKFGFEPIAELIDGAATADALHWLANDGLRRVGPADSLVVFFAGHGHSHSVPFPDGTIARRGYLVPADAQGPTGAISSWIRLDSWLSDLAQLQAHHILVVLDACHAGIALGGLTRWRDHPTAASPVLEALQSRRSRRVLTSALDDQRAADSGPVPGHSLFTGCLIQALDGELARAGKSHVTGSMLWSYLLDELSKYPGGEQTPDFGAFELDARGELVLPLHAPDVGADRPAPEASSAWQPGHRLGPTPAAIAEARRPGHQLGPSSTSITSSPRDPALGPPGHRLGPTNPSLPRHDRLGWTARLPPMATAPRSRGDMSDPALGAGPMRGFRAPGDLTPPPRATSSRPALDLRDPPAAWPGVAMLPAEHAGIDDAFALALERHTAERARGSHVLSVLIGPPAQALTSAARWAAWHGCLTLVTEGDGVDAAIDELLAQMPWPRALSSARRALAAAAAIEVDALDAALDEWPARRGAPWRTDLADGSPVLELSGWLVAALRGEGTQVPDSAAVPVHGDALVEGLRALALPIAIVVHHPSPTHDWLVRALRTASVLVSLLPRAAVLATAPEDLFERVLRETPDSAALSMARQGAVTLPVRPRTAPGATRAAAADALHAALWRDPRTAGAFVRAARTVLVAGIPPVEVALMCTHARIAIELDGWYRGADLAGYRNERITDVRLRQAGYLTLRYVIDDLEGRLTSVVDDIAGALGARRAPHPAGRNP